MGNNDIKVKDLSTTSSISTDNKLILLTDEANNTVQNITVENALANIISSNANNSLSIGSDKKLYTPDISGEVGDLDNLITTNKTNIVSAINEVKGDTNAITGSVVPASKGWLEEGEIYQKANWYGEKLYNDVYSYNHSTFDVSKFTVTGSPIITDDGIISGITYSTDWLRTTYVVPVSTANSWAIGVKRFKVNSLSNGQRIFSFNSSNTFISVETNGQIKVYVSASTTGDIVNNQYADYTVTLNEVIDAELRFTGTAYEVWINGNKTYSKSSTTKISANQAVAIFSGGSGFAPCIGEHDLKQFSITVNGIPVFSGNKTGIDTYTINNSDVSIPYTLSSTGSKIVDVAYRDRVIDVYNQFGSANYYTIDETNQNATLPMGEIYGFIEQTKENFSVPAYGNQDIGVTITDNLTYTCPDDGFIYCYNIQVTAGGGFELSISRNGQSSLLISFGGISVDASLQIPFIYPVEKGDVAQILWSSTSVTYPILYFVPKKGV